MECYIYHDISWGVIITTYQCKNYKFKKAVGINLHNKSKETRAANINPTRFYPYFGRIILFIRTCTHNEICAFIHVDV